MWLGWQVLSLVQWDCEILLSTISLEGINWYLRFFAWRFSSRESNMSEATTLGGCDQLCLLSNQNAGSFDQQYLWKESIDEISRECNMWDTIFGWVGLGVSHIQYSQKNPSIIKSPKTFLVFNLTRELWKKGILWHKCKRPFVRTLPFYFSIFNDHFASYIELDGGPFSYEFFFSI